MASWRKVHVKEEEWKWVISKGYGLNVVIKDPGGKCHTVSFSQIDPPLPDFDPIDETWDYIITPGKVKSYIENNLV